MEMLKSLDRLVIRETGDSSAKYVVASSEGTVLLKAREDSGLLDQMLAGKSRAFEIDIFDTDDKEVIKLRRPYTVGSDKMDVCVSGEVAAVVRKEVTLLKPVLVINDCADQTIIRVKGPVSISAECNFELYSADKKRVGGIRRLWKRAGSQRELFALHFPQTLDVRYKAAVIGTCFLIPGVSHCLIPGVSRLDGDYLAKVEELIDVFQCPALNGNWLMKGVGHQLGLRHIHI